MNEQERILAAEMEEICESYEQAQMIAEHLIALDYRKERYCEWVLDDSYTGKDKEIYVCSACNRYQSIKKSRSREKLKYMSFCPVCGAKAINVVIQ